MICYFHTVLGILTISWCFFPSGFVSELMAPLQRIPWTTRSFCVFKTTCCTLLLANHAHDSYSIVPALFLNNCVKFIQFLISPFSALLYKQMSASHDSSRYIFEASSRFYLIYFSSMSTSGSSLFGLFYFMHCLCMFEMCYILYRLSSLTVAERMQHIKVWSWTTT